MKVILTTLALMISTAFTAVASEGWGTDFEAAFAQAKKENKDVLVEFTGSDWCIPCQVLKRNVFSQESFISRASQNFVLIELDFPQNDKDLAKKNEPYAERYNVEFFPSIILFNSEGQEYERFVASEYPSVDQFIAHLEKVKK